MSLSKQDIQHIAELAHLRLTEEETAKFGEQLSSILEYVGQLSKVDVSGLEPAAHITGVSNVLRRDEVRPTPSEVRQTLLEAAPAREGDLIKVKAVFK
jgi:aspartyl-tRNA(Asn)/glutamyl-tRNA(Gln) amidotransferase subunit C